jgi:hypothetical protein
MYTENDLGAEISTATERWWKDEQAPLLISRLGLAELSDTAREFVRENKISLKRFIRSRLGETVRFVPMQRQGGGVAPIAETLALSDFQLESAYVPKNAESHTEGAITRFYPEVWAAFRDPLPDGQKRILSLASGRPSVELKPVDAALADGQYAIEASDTAMTSHPEQPPSAAEIRSAITNWSEARGIHMDHLIRPSRGPGPAPRRQRESHGSGPLEAVSFLEALRAIPPLQLAKVSFPGDVVLSLLERFNQR